MRDIIFVFLMSLLLIGGIMTFNYYDRIYECGELKETPLQSAIIETFFFIDCKGNFIYE